MIDLLIITGMILWTIATIAVACGTVSLGIDADSARESATVWIVGLALFAASTAGLVFTISSNGWFDDELPPDGCYHLSRDTDYIPITTGKTTTLTPVEDVTFTPISCPGGGR